MIKARKAVEGLKEDVIHLRRKLHSIERAREACSRTSGNILKGWEHG